ncbi:hypothetical protein NIES2107_20540 [Nostoc carneum NIES-2107]|nr:hypothetical protein NIES2107_20540 [Nostoc carneum NIES-2107]
MQGWRLDANFRYQQLVANERGWLWCETLGFWLGTWEGTIDRETAPWLRFYDRQSNLVFLPEEAAFQRAEVESQRAETEHQRAEAESQRAEAERQRAERLAARLRELGENPEDF